MANKTLHINEEQLKRILTESVKEVLDEIGYRTATIPTISNIDSADELAKGNDIRIMPSGKISDLKQRRGKASEMSYRVITQGVKDNVGDNFTLTFGRQEEDRTVSNLDFHFQEIILLTANRFVMQGTCETSRSPISVSKFKPKKIQIDYQFQNGNFYEAVYCANGTIRDRKILTLDHAGTHGYSNVNTAKALIQFLTMCLYSIDDGITAINNK
jgi:hypothetical protein